MKIYIPSYKRAGNVRTLFQFSYAAKKEIVLVVRREEATAYSTHLPNVKIIPIDKPVKNIGQTRQWILNQHKGNQPFVMMDDDLTFARRNSENRSKFQAATSSDVDAMLADLRQTLGTVAHVGVLARQGANNVQEKYSTCNTRMMRVLGYQPAILRAHAIRFDRNPPMEDFDVTLCLLRAGVSNAVLTEYVQDHGSSNAVGGCSEQRSLEKLAAAAHKLHALHPDFVKVVQKATKSGWGSATEVVRTDVIVYWKKAFASSVARN